MKERMGGAADRVVLYHADAVGLYIWQKYNHLFAPDHGQHLTEGGAGAHDSKLIEDMNILHFFGTI